jgi:hypothetical protein
MNNFLNRFFAWLFKQPSEEVITFTLIITYIAKIISIRQTIITIMTVARIWGKFLSQALKTLFTFVKSKIYGTDRSRKEVFPLSDASESKPERD